MFKGDGIWGEEKIFYLVHVLCIIHLENLRNDHSLVIQKRPIKLIIVIKNVQNGARKPHTKNNIYIPHPYLYTFMQRADTVLCVFLCRVAAKQNEASESGDSVRTLDRTKEPLGERSPLFEIDQFFVSPIRDKFYAPVLCV